jgi:hypothetical protein
MTLVLKRANYTNPYYTNWFYLDNMIDLLRKPLNEITWRENEYISDSFSLWILPDARVNEKYAKYSVESFIDSLNDKIKGL